MYLSQRIILISKLVQYILRLLVCSLRVLVYPGTLHLPVTQCHYRAWLLRWGGVETHLYLTLEHINLGLLILDNHLQLIQHSKVNCFFLPLCSWRNVSLHAKQPISPFSLLKQISGQSGNNSVQGINFIVYFFLREWPVRRIRVNRRGVRRRVKLRLRTLRKCLLKLHSCHRPSLFSRNASLLGWCVSRYWVLLLFIAVDKIVNLFSGLFVIRSWLVCRLHVSHTLGFRGLIVDHRLWKNQFWRRPLREDLFSRSHRSPILHLHWELRPFNYCEILLLWGCGDGPLIDFWRVSEGARHLSCWNIEGKWGTYVLHFAF